MHQERNHNSIINVFLKKLIMKRKLLFTLLLVFNMGFVFTSNLMAQMVLEFNTNLSWGTTVTLPLYGTVNVTVDWGDGNSESFVTIGDKSHTYTAEGVYTVSISGALTQFGSGDQYNNAKKLVKVTSFGNLGLTSLNGAFDMASNLVEVPTILPATITNLSSSFQSTGQTSITGLDSWDVSNVENMYFMFCAADIFNQDISSWDVSNVTNMKGMFYSAHAFNQPLNSWDVSKVTNMVNMFNSAYTFNQPLNSWDVSSVLYMSDMFQLAKAFNQPLNDWDVSNVRYMILMFSGTNSFNQPLNDWDVSRVRDMWGMFSGAVAFNQPLNDWDVSRVRDMLWMFEDAIVFNQPLNNWDVHHVKSMWGMFDGALSFDQPLNDWDVSNVKFMNNMFHDVTLSTANYSSLLISWATLDLYDGVSFDGGLSKYNPGAAEDARTAIIADHSWTITDAGLEIPPVPLSNWSIIFAILLIGTVIWFRWFK